MDESKILKQIEMFEMLFYDLAHLFAGAAFIAFLLKLFILAILVFAVIGVITTIKFFANRKKNKETDGQYWLRTGRTRDKK